METPTEPTLRFLRGEGELLARFAAESRQLPDDLGERADQAAVREEFARRFPTGTLFALYVRVPDDQLRRIAGDLVHAVAALFSAARRGRPGAAEALAAVAEFGAEFERRVGELERLRAS